MPRKIKVIHETIEDEPIDLEIIDEVEPQVEPVCEVVEPPKIKKPRAPRKPKVAPVAVEVPVLAPVQVEVAEDKIAPLKKGKGRPKLSDEEKENRKALKSVKLEEAQNKVISKITKDAKQEAKKKVISKIKQTLQQEDIDSLTSSDDEELAEILKQQKKPIVIINKMDKPSGRKTMQPPPPSVIFA